MQVGDVELAGGVYMVVPGSYRRMSDGEPEGRPGRVVVRDFVGGQRRAVQLEDDRGWDAEGSGPVYDGRGVQPWPYVASYTDSGGLTTVRTSTRAPSIIADDRVYVGNGRYLYRSDVLSASSWINFVQRSDYGSGKEITDLAVHAPGKLAVLFGSTNDIQIHDTAAGTNAVLRAGRKGNCGVGYAGFVIFGGQDGHTVRMDDGTNQASRILDGVPRRMALHAGKVAIATKTGSLWLLGGRYDAAKTDWNSDPEPLFTHGYYTDDQDYLFLVSYRGRLYTWLTGRVMEFNPNTGNNRQGWVPTPIEGRACHGGVVAGGWLIVCMTSLQGAYQVWGFDGSGWWLLRHVTSSARCWPAWLGGCGTYDLLAFRDGSSSVTYDLYRLTNKGSTTPELRDSGEYRTSLLDAGAPDSLKAWRKVGATFAAPEIRGNTSSTDAVTVTLSYSIDGGMSWIQVATQTVNDPYLLRVLTLEGEVASAAAVSRFLQLRVQWSSVLDWAPVLTAVWAEYELLGAPARRRRWQFSVRAKDQAVRRDGTVDPRSGRQQIADLWAAWQGAETVPFKDVDYDADAVTRQVRIIGIREEVPKPSDAGRWGESVLTLTLVEV